MAEGGGVTLEYTPTWVVALVCTVIVALSLLVERILHYAGKVSPLPIPHFHHHRRRRGVIYYIFCSI